MDLKDILIQYREENRISQRELARRCGLSNAQISILEYGKNKQTGRKPTPDITITPARPTKPGKAVIKNPSRRIIWKAPSWTLSLIMFYQMIR